MLPVISRRLVHPLHERLLRRPTLRYARELEDSQWLAPDDLRRLQQEKLRALLVHAQAQTRFYRERLGRAAVDIHGDDPSQVLRRLPMLTKAEIRGSIDDMVWHEAPGGLYSRSTGGSSGEPLTFFCDRRRQAYDQAARIRAHRWFGVNVGDKELYLWGSPIESQGAAALKQMRDRLFNHRLLSAFDMSAARMDAYLDAWERYRPACAFGYPSSLALLAEHAQRRKRRLNTRGLRAVFVTGEVCYPHHKDAIASYFQAPIADGYGSREAGFIAHQCPKGRMHLTAENVWAEIVRDGRPVPIGGTGEIVITHLDAYAMPFIRYRTGDMGRLVPGRCPCGRGLPMMEIVGGRVTDFLYLPDGTVKHALSIIYPLRETPGIRQFRVTQHEDFAVTVDVVADDPGGGLTQDAIARRARPVLGSEIDVRVRLVDRIATAGSGKFRYVVSHAGPQNADPLAETPVLV